MMPEERYIELDITYGTDEGAPRFRDVRVWQGTRPARDAT